MNRIILFLIVIGKYRQNKEGIGKITTRTLPVSYPKMAPCRH